MEESTLFDQRMYLAEEMRDYGRYPAVSPRVPEPKWLHRRAEFERELALMKAERAAKPVDAEQAPRLKQLFRFAFSRG